uniref:Uncharacterized protein n=1 Tax=Molossus molossus TaxID=27622 RepID=A0A7J8IZD9_MOLMO|nr:hypothetical protein HJG59_010328 [Molossus molossus]
MNGSVVYFLSLIQKANGILFSHHHLSRVLFHLHPFPTAVTTPLSMSVSSLPLLLNPLTPQHHPPPKKNIHTHVKWFLIKTLCWELKKLCTKRQETFYLWFCSELRAGTMSRALNLPLFLLQPIK